MDGWRHEKRERDRRNKENMQRTRTGLPGLGILIEADEHLALLGGCCFLGARHGWRLTGQSKAWTGGVVLCCAAGWRDGEEEDVVVEESVVGGLPGRGSGRARG